MAPFTAPSQTRSITARTISLLVVFQIAFLIILFLLLSHSYTGTDKPCSCPSTTGTTIAATTSSESNSIPIKTDKEDTDWIRAQLVRNHLDAALLSPDEWYKRRKGINPRTREQQLEHLRNHKGISHYEGSEADKHTALPIALDLLVEKHHGYYGEPWAGGRDVFEFLSSATNLAPSDRVLEVGCGTLRAGRHFIQYLETAHFHCFEKDAASLMAAITYELISNGLTYKRPVIIRGEVQNIDMSKFGDNYLYDLIYASAVFLHVEDEFVWVGIERLVNRLNPDNGRLFISHNVKFCSRLGEKECNRWLNKLGLEYVGKLRHDSVLFNHYEIWFEFRRFEVSR